LQKNLTLFLACLSYRKIGKQQVVFFLQKTLPSLPTLHLGCLSLANSGFLPLVKSSGSFYVYFLN